MAISMKVLIDCSQLNVGGGIQVGLSFLLKTSTYKALELIVIASNAIDQQLSSETKDEFYAYHVVDGNSTLQKILQVQEFHRWEKKYKPNLVFTVFGPSIWRPKAPCIQGFALGLMFYPEVQDILKYSLAKKLKVRAKYYIKQHLFKTNADYFIVETEVVKARLCKLLNVPKENIYVIENSYSPYFKTYNKKVEISKDGYFKFLVPSSYYPHKNLEILAKVADKLYATNQKVRFYFMLNNSDFNKITAPLAHKPSKHLMSNLGKVNISDLPQHYYECDGVILPTLAESSTSTYPEAFITKKLLLTSDRDFSRYLCGDAAIFFDPLDSNDIYNKIVEILNGPEVIEQTVSLSKSQLNLRYVSDIQKWKKQISLLTKLAKENSKF